MTIQEILDEFPPCATQANGTAMPCTCDFMCVNYALLAHGYTTQDMMQPKPDAE